MAHHINVPVRTPFRRWRRCWPTPSFARFRFATAAPALPSTATFPPSTLTSTLARPRRQAQVHARPWLTRPSRGGWAGRVLSDRCARTVCFVQRAAAGRTACRKSSGASSTTLSAFASKLVRPRATGPGRVPTLARSADMDPPLPPPLRGHPATTDLTAKITVARHVLANPPDWAHLDVQLGRTQPCR